MARRPQGPPAFATAPSSNPRWLIGALALALIAATATAVWTLIGFGFGMLVRNQIAAVLIAVAFGFLGQLILNIAFAILGLLARTEGIDATAVRQAAAADPTDVDAALAVADLDVLGGHVSDAFTRLVDLVKATQGDERARVRAHLLELFAVVGNHDERVRRGRTALMSALF